MRIGASILLLDGYCYQSFQWKFLRPLGKLKHVLKFLDLYNVDEVCISRPIKKNDFDTSLANDLNQIKLSLSNSPISFGGGLRSLNQLKLLTNLPIERLHFSSAFIDRKINILEKSLNLYGKQAIVATLPIKVIDDHMFVFHCSVNGFVPLKSKILNLINDYADELMIIDIENEGRNDCFNFEILEKLDFSINQVIISGGVGPKVIKIAKKMGVASCLIENRVLHHENYIHSEL